MNQAVTFLTDGGDDVRNLAAEMAPYAEHYLDWFHVTMRLTVLASSPRAWLTRPGSRRADRSQPAADQAVSVARQHPGGLFWIDCLTDDIDGLEAECAYPKLKAFLTTTEEFATYIRRNAHAIPNYGERYRNHERVATSFVESAVDIVIAKRFNKKQQMQWT